MDINTNTNNENVIPKLNIPNIFYPLIGVLCFMIIILFLIMFNVNLNIFSLGKDVKSNEELAANIFVILFFSLLVFGLCVLFLPNFKNFKKLFEQIGNVTYAFLFTIFFILFYNMIPGDILSNYYFIINPLMLGLGAFSFYKGFTENYIEQFDINYERIKMIIMLFCLITIIITFYNVNPGGSAQKYFGYSLLLTIIIAVFGFLYLIIIMTLPNKDGSQKENLLSNFSSFGKYGSILFIIFLIVIVAIISSDNGFFENKSKSASVIILLLIICILWSILLGSNLFSGETKLNDIKTIKSSLIFLLGLVISGLIIYWIAYNIESLSSNSSITSFVLNLILVGLILGLVYKTIYVKMPVGNTKKNAFFALITNTILYIPCLLGGLFDWFGKNTIGSQDTGSNIMLLVTIVLIIIYFNISKVFNAISTQGGNQLVNKPVYTDTQYNLGTYQELNGNDDYEYQFAISCWIFIDAAPPNMNSNYTKYTSLLNFGNKPNVLYNGKQNSLMITMQQKDLKVNTENKLTDFDEEGNRIIYINKNVPLQKWNNLIINYNGGTLDIFLNGELVKSSIQVVPYYTLDNLTIGEDNGIQGGICNVIYFRKVLSSNNIYYLYNSVKENNPPTLNESNETILVKNINQIGSSITSVI
jgi:hypothetical protein